MQPAENDVVQWQPLPMDCLHEAPCASNAHQARHKNAKSGKLGASPEYGHTRLYNETDADECAQYTKGHEHQHNQEHDDHSVSIISVANH
jgi:hypothetical protein